MKRQKLGWTFAGFLFVAVSLGSAPAFTDTLTLHVIRPEPKLLWHQPRAVLMSTLVAYLRTTGFLIGHVSVRLQCAAGPEGAEVDSWAGMVPLDEDDEIRALLQDKLGFGVLFKTYAGALQSRKEIEEDLAWIAREPERLAVIRYRISAASCRRMARYLEEYIERGYSKFYGLPNRPRYGEGSGCSAFAVSFMEVGGVLQPSEDAAWSRQVRVPEDLIGNPSIGKRVEIGHVFRDPVGARWALPSEPGREIRFYDPALIFDWAVKAASKPQAPIEVEIDRSMLPVPSEPIWLTGP